MHPVEEVSGSENEQVFRTTLWTVVFTIRSSDPVAASRALERLCQLYWRPVHAFIRRRGASPHDAEDLTQAFFAALLANETLSKADRERGRFRTFLLATLTNFLHNEWDKHRRLKRGGNCEVVSLSAAESEYLELPGQDVNPERMFDRHWAFSLITHARLRLRAELAAEGKLEAFQKLEPHLTQELTAPTCAKLAVELKLNEGAVRISLHRLRRRFGEALRMEIAQTVSTREEIDEELQHLFNAVGS